MHFFYQIPQSQQQQDDPSFNLPNARPYPMRRDFPGYDGYVTPPIEEIGLRVRRGRPIKVEPIVKEDLYHLTSRGRTFDNIFSIMKVHQNITGIPCMGMHHWDGYDGNAKNLVGILINNGRTFIKALNATEIGGTDLKVRGSYVSPRCPSKKLEVLERKFLWIDYIDYDNDDIRNLTQEQLKEIVETHSGYHVKLKLDGDAAICVAVILREITRGFDPCGETTKNQ